MTHPNLGNGGGSSIPSGKILIAKSCLKQQFLKSKIKKLNPHPFVLCIYNYVTSLVHLQSIHLCFKTEVGLTNFCHYFCCLQIYE